MHTSGALLDGTWLAHWRRAGTVLVFVLVRRNAGFLSNVEAEVTQQLLRIGSHASMVVFGGNNEVEQSLDWYEETVSNVAMYAADYSALFEHTIAPLVQKVSWFETGCCCAWGRGWLVWAASGVCVSDQGLLQCGSNCLAALCPLFLTLPALCMPPPAMSCL